MRLYLIRHCKAAGQAPDAPLTEEGRQQAERLAQRLQGEGIEAIWSSPFLRAIATAEPLARRVGLQVETDARLKERVLSGGALENWREDLERTFSEPDLAFAGGESSRAATDRALSALHDLSSKGPAVAAAVTHGNLLALILHSLDPSFGYPQWDAMRNPDCYVIEDFGAGAAFTRDW